jgi:predicted aspartyl protease
MIKGVVTAARVATVQLAIRGDSGSELIVDAELDTGFSGPLTIEQLP